MSGRGDQQDPDGFSAAIDALASSETLTIALDFDGTLAPFTDDPDDSRAIPEAVSAIERLSILDNTNVALVSGRAVDSLRRVSGAPAGVILIGSHGAEYVVEGTDAALPLSEKERLAVDGIGRALRAVAQHHPLVRIEAKPAGYAFHTRLVSSDEKAATAQLDARAAVFEAVPDTNVRGGKDVIEFSVLSATKGDAMRRLRDLSPGTVILYVGDDVTDEDAFAALAEGDVAVKCGAGDTIARFRLDGPPEVASLLHAIADRRSDSLTHPAAHRSS